MNRFVYLSLASKGSGFKPNEELLKNGKIQLNTKDIGKYRISYSSNIKYFFLNEIHCFILGDIYEYNSNDDILCIYKDADNVKKTDGFFTIIFIYNDNIKIISDQSCLYPIYYYNNDHLILSTIAYEVAAFLKSYPNIEEINIYLCTGKTLHGNTIYKDVFALKSETVLTFNNNSTREYNYGNYNDFLDLNVTVDVIAKDLKQIIRNGYKYLKDTKGFNNFLCDLSGGADSRITALMAKNLFGKIDIYTGGTQKEKEISCKVNRKGLNNSKYLTRIELQENIDAKVCNLVAGCKDYKFIKKMYLVDKFEGSQYDVKIDGEGGSNFKDFWIKNVFPQSKLYKIGLSDKELDFLISTRFLHKKPIIKSYHETLEYIKENIKKNITFDIRKDKIIDQIYIKYYNRPSSYISRQIGNLFYTNWSPFYSNKYVLYCRKITPEHRFYDNIHSNIIYSISKFCSFIATDRSVFGLYPFKLVPKTKFNIPYYIFWETLYNIQRLILKIFNIVKRFTKFNKSIIRDNRSNPKIQINEFLINIIPNITELKDDSLIISLNLFFDYLEDK